MNRHRLVLGTVLAIGALIAGSGSQVRAATVTVQAGQENGGTAAERQFNAASITIQAGDTVNWQWFADEHDITAYDGSWSSPLLTGPGQSFQRTFPVVGTFTYYCDRHAGTSDARPDRIDESIIDGKMVGKVTVLPVTDASGPMTSNLAAAPNPTDGASSITITADVSDVSQGGSNIAAAEYFFDATGIAGSGTPMNAADGAFNSAAEGVTANASVSGLGAGVHQVYVRARDVAGNWGELASTVLTVATPGTTLSLSAQPVSFGNVSIIGADQLVTTTPSPWRATDGRGSGEGWHVTLQSTDFAAATATIPVSHVKVQVRPSSIATIAGNAPPTSAVMSYQPLSTSPLKLIAAGPGTGMGTYDFSPDFQLTLPASAYAGTYTAAFTTSVNSGP